MKKYNEKVLLAGIVLVFGLIIYFPAHKEARAHVNYVTAVEDHPLNCASCHLYTSKNKFISKMINEEYLSPYNLAITKDGKKLFVIAQEANALLVVDAESKKVLNKIKVGERPHSIVLSQDEKLAYVSNQWADNVYSIDLANAKVVDTLRTDGGPAGLAISNDGKFLYVVNSFTSNVSVIDLKTKEEIKRLTVGNNPTGAQISPNGQKIYVTSRRANQVPYGDPVMSDLGVVNTESNRIAEQKSMESAYMMEKVAFTPSGDLALVTLIRPKNLVPSIQVERGWMMTNGIGIIEQKENGRIMQLLLDRPNSYFADPYDVVTSIDGKRAFVSSAGTNSISVIEMDSVRSLLKIATPALLHSWADNLDMSSRFVSKRISTGSNPKGLAVSPDGKFLYVAEMLEDKIRVISTESLETIGSIDLGGPRRITVARQGRRLFNNAGHTFQQQYSCYTCHPDHHEDGLVYNMASKDMGRNLTNTQSLRDIGDTPPFKWNGKNQTIYKQDGMRFSTVLTRTEAFSYNDLDAIAAYITRGIPNPPNLKYNPKGELTESQLRGKAIYERTHDNTGKEIPIGNRCITCHPPPFYTNLKMADVGTLAATDDTMKFDTPHLNNIFASPPYLHDGRAMTLEEIWTKNNPKDKHGVGNDMTKNQLNDLVDYLKSLRDPKYEENNSTKHDSHNSKKSNQS